MGLRKHVLLAFMAAVAATSGCGAERNGAATTAATSAEPANPTPQSEEARRALRNPNSAASAVLAFWRYVGTGALPATHALYDNEVTAAIGEAEFAGALALQQQTASKTDLRVFHVEPVAEGMLVLAETLPEGQSAAQWSFFLKREGGRWRIMYDSFTATALSYYVQQQVQRGIDPDAESPSPEALDAADRAVARFREAALRSAGGELPGVPDTSTP